MTELAALNVRISGDASGLRGALQSAEAGLERVSTQATATQRQVAATSGGMSRLGQVFQRNGFAISNAANQFSDLAVQMSMGVPASRALSQQLPQMTAFMGPLVSILGVGSGVLIGVAGSFLAARDGANEFQDAIDSLSENTQELRDELFMLTQGLDNLAQVAAVRELQEIESNIASLTAEIAQLENERGARATRQLRVARATLEAEQQRAEEIRSQIAENETLTDEVEAARDAARQLEENARNVDFSNAITGAERLARILRYANSQISEGDATRGIAGFEGNDPRGGGGPIFTGLTRTVREWSPDGEDQGGMGGGAAGVNPLIGQLESLEQSLLTAEELQVQSYQRQQETLEQALNQRLLTQQEYARMMEQVEQSHQFAMVQAANDGARQTLSNLATVFQGSKEISAGIALANSWLAFTEVLKDPSFIGRPFARIAAAGAALSSGLQAVRNIKSASRGGVSGGAGGAAMAGPAMNAGGGGTSSNVAIQLTGGDMFSRDQVVQLINKINEAVEDGAVVRLV